MSEVYSNLDSPAKTEEELDSINSSNFVSSFKLQLFLFKMIFTLVLIFTLNDTIFYTINEISKFLRTDLSIIIDPEIYLGIQMSVLFLFILFTIYYRYIKLHPLIYITLILIMILEESNIVIGIIKFNLMLYLFDLPDFMKNYSYYLNKNTSKYPLKTNINEIILLKEMFFRQISQYFQIFVLLTIGTLVLMVLFLIVTINFLYIIIIIPIMLVLTILSDKLIEIINSM